MNSRLVGAAILVIASLSASTARAGIVFDNLGQPSTQNLSIFSFGITGDSFSTGSTASYLTDVQVLLEGGGNTNGSITMALFSDSGGVPTTNLATLGTLADSQATYNPAVYDFSSFSPIALSANTSYYIVLYSSYSNLGWVYTSGDGGTGVSGQTYYAVGNTHSDTQNPFQMQVTTSLSTVPEPSSLLLCGVACLGGLTIRASRVGRAVPRP